MGNGTLHGDDPASAWLASAEPRDRAFMEYWSRVIDVSDPAAPHWMTHFAKRVGECQKIAREIEAHRTLAEARALDVGCQTGALAVVMAERGARVVGIDTEDWLLEAARRRAAGWGARAEFQVASGVALPFDDESFDIVTFVDVIEHCRDGDRCLREIARVLRPGGVAYVLGPNRFAIEWLLSDPHYRLMGASVLPHAWGKRYVEWRRGKPGYDVGVFPVGTRAADTLRRSGLEIVDSPVHAVMRRWKQLVSLDSPWLAALARGWGGVRLAMLPTFVLVARKPGAST